MIASTSSSMAAYLPEEGAREVFAEGTHSLNAGVFAPMGRAIPVEGGFRVTGRWPFGSAGLHAGWISGGCFVENQTDRTVMTAFFPASAVEILDTWHVAGLRGTGSNDFAVEDVFVPTRRTACLQIQEPRTDDPLYRFPPFGLLALGIAAVALGIGQGAIDDLRALASGKVPTGSRRRLAERPAIQEAVARAEAMVGAAESFLMTEVENAWRRAQEGHIDVTTRSRVRLACTHAVDQATQAVDLMYRAGGGTSIYESCRLQQRFRDIHTATQHMMVAQPTWEVVGRVLLDVETDTSSL
jgi:alkylation response protein AidB-like acyl-CoA dehydrogenase